MTEKANPSVNRTAEAYKTAGAIAYGGHGESGWVVPSSNPTNIATQDPGIDETVLNAFSETSSGSSFDVDIAGGEAFVFGSWLAIDTVTTVTLASSTNNQTVYVGWNKGGADDVIVGLDSAFSTATGDTDEKIPLYDFDTDGSGVTSVTDRRSVGQKTVGKVVKNTSNQSSAYTTDGDQIVFVDTSGSSVTITLSDDDTEDGNIITIVDISGNASNNNITVNTESSQTIDGSSSTTVESNYGAARFASDGTDWYSAGGGSGISLADGDRLEFGNSADVTLRYDSNNDDFRWEDGGNNEDRMALERTTGNLEIEGTLSEGQTL